MLDQHYQTMYKQAASLQHQFHDYSHPMAHDPMAHVLRQEIHNLTNDIATNKNPRTIEERLRTIQTQIRNTQAVHPTTPGSYANPLLNHNQSNLLHTNFEQMRQGFRQHPKW